MLGIGEPRLRHLRTQAHAGWTASDHADILAPLSKPALRLQDGPFPSRAYTNETLPTVPLPLGRLR
ncbi:MAG: hypothetical protein ACI841_005107 [Planctomycetota bacterium]|jgi:hypothetical protein